MIYIKTTSKGMQMRLCHGSINHLKPVLTIKNIAVQAIFTLTTFSFSHAATLSVNVVDKDGKPAVDAVVMVVTSSVSSPKTLLPMSATISQASMQFIPAVTIVRPGAKVTFVNNDPWDHHVRGSAAGAAQFSGNDENGFVLRLSGKTAGATGKSSVVTLDNAGVVLLGCHLHGSMVGHVVVSDTPWAVKTDANGIATFTDLPDGAATVKVWHAAQFVDLKPVQTTLSAAPAQVKMQLSVTPRRRAAASGSAAAPEKFSY
jgi:plastocyanin